jgi:hypothetical protein
MSTRAPHGTDLIIGMTLAETFLLIVFVVWYSQGAGAGPEWEGIAKKRETQIQDLKAELQLQKEKVLELERIRDWWRRNFGTNPPASMDEVEVALRTKGMAIAKVERTIAKGPGRSNLTPRCSELGLKDVLFDTVILGRDVYEVNGQNKNLEELLSAYAPDLRAAGIKECRYSINVSYRQDVGTDDFVVALLVVRVTPDRWRRHFRVYADCR